MSLERRLLKLLRRVRNGMRKPKLLQTTPQGGTIHSYDIEGGKHTFERFLACQEGSCVFYNTMKDAENYLVKF